jgi:hypothetical protein
VETIRTKAAKIGVAIGRDDGAIHRANNLNAVAARKIDVFLAIMFYLLASDGVDHRPTCT